MTTRSCCWMICLAIVTLNLAGCQKGLQGKYVCTQNTVNPMLASIDPTANDPSRRPALDFRRDGTVYLDNIAYGQGHFAGTYNLEGNQLRISVAGGLEVHQGVVKGKTIETDFTVPNYGNMNNTQTPQTTEDLAAMDIKLSFVKQ